MDDFLRSKSLVEDYGYTWVVVPENGSDEIIAFYTIDPDPIVGIADDEYGEHPVVFITLAVLGVDASFGHRRTVELLLKHGANINAQDTSGQTPLMKAIRSGTSTVVYLLLTQGANPNVQDLAGETALYDAINSPLAHSVIPDLLAHGANPNLRNKEGDTPLQMAQEAGDADMVRWLKGGAGR